MLSMDTSPIRLSLRPRWCGYLFLAAVMLGGVFLAAETLRFALAQTWGESYELTNVQRAIALDGSNPELYYWIGTLELTGAADPATAVASLRKATQLNPNQARYWLGLARGCFASGDRSCADQAFERSIELAPSKPSMEWEAGSYYVVTNRPDSAFAHFRRLLQMDPEQAWQVFQLTGRAFDDPALIWQKVVSGSKNSKVECAYLDFLAAEKRFDLAGIYWTEIEAAHSNISFEAVKPYLQRLIDAQHYVEAVALWEDLLRLGVVSRPNSQGSNNLVFNGSFELPILNAGFDWQPHPQDYVNLDFSEPAARGQGHSLQVEFTAPHNADVELIDQLVPVAPNQNYQLTAYVRSEEITSDSGPRLRVQYPQCPACLDAVMESTVGTTPLHQVTMAFATGPQTSIVRLSLWRPRGRSFPMDIQGRFWLESVTLKPVTPAIDGASL